MSHEFTRQRQGKDFTEQNHVKNDDDKKSLLNRLDQYKAETNRNNVPVDGHEPPERGR